ncbi:MAG: hydrogenase maturation protease [Marmoricola sp.]
MRLLVAGVGNIFLHDDGFGPETVRRMAGDGLPADVEVVDYGIRGMHLAYDLLDGYDALVLVDTVPGDGEAGTLTVLRAPDGGFAGGEFDGHGMDPVAVLGHLRRLGGELPPTYVVGCRPGDTSDGMGLTPAVDAAVAHAVRLTRNLVAHLLEGDTLTTSTTAKEA